MEEKEAVKPKAKEEDTEIKPSPQEILKTLDDKVQHLWSMFEHITRRANSLENQIADRKKKMDLQSDLMEIFDRSCQQSYACSKTIMFSLRSFLDSIESMIQDTKKANLDSASLIGIEPFLPSSPVKKLDSETEDCSENGEPTPAPTPSLQDELLDEEICSKICQEFKLPDCAYLHTFVELFGWLHAEGTDGDTTEPTIDNFIELLAFLSKTGTNSLVTPLVTAVVEYARIKTLGNDLLALGLYEAYGHKNPFGDQSPLVKEEDGFLKVDFDTRRTEATGDAKEGETAV